MGIINEWDQLYWSKIFGDDDEFLNLNEDIEISEEDWEEGNDNIPVNK